MPAPGVDPRGRSDEPDATCVYLAATQDTWLGKKVLNNFTWFYNSHMFMFGVFYVAVILHPWPGLPGYPHRHGNSVTWVCLHPARSIPEHPSSFLPLSAFACAENVSIVCLV